MWYLQFFPHWIFYGILGIGISGIIFSRFLPFYYKTAVQAVVCRMRKLGVAAFCILRGSLELNMANTDSNPE
jgi:hypothetical protein